jgi:hypothetical protein
MNKRVQVQIKDMNIKKETRFVLITESRNKIGVLLMLTRVRDNVPQLSIYTLDIYSILLVAQAIFMVVA